MYAIVDVKDKQFKVRENDTLYVPYHSDLETDDELTLDRVLLVSDGEGDVTLGTPSIDDASVQARVVEHVKGDKVIVFKKKRRKRYRVKRGHRQHYTQIRIESLDVNGVSTSAEEEANPGGTDVESSAADAVAESSADDEPDAAGDGEATESSAAADPEAEANTTASDTDSADEHENA